MSKRNTLRMLLAPVAALVVLAVAAGPASAKTKTATKTVCTPSGAAIPNAENSLARVPVTLGQLPKKAKILDVNATLRVTHPGLDEMVVYLASPGGKLAMLSDNHRINPGSDFGTGAGCAGTPTTWDDEAAVSIDAGNDPFAGSFQPFTPLSVMDGGPAAGSFTFILEDLDTSPSGPQTVDAAGVTVTYVYPVKKKKKKSKKSAASAKTKFVNRTGTKDVCTDLAVPVNNGTGNDRTTINPVAIATGKLPKKAKITDVDARLRMTHSYAGDLEFFLFSPTGAIVPLWLGYDESQPDFGTGATDCSGTPTVFDDEAPVSILNATAPYAGSFQPLVPLSSLDGLAAAGTWTLYVNDHYSGDVGTVHAAGLNIDYRYRAKKKAKK